MSALMEKVTTFLHEDDLEYEYDGNNLVGMVFMGNNGHLRCFIRGDDKLDYISVLTRYPLNILKEKRHEVAELVARINFPLRVGSFKIDMHDGEVNFKYGVFLEASTPGQELIKRLFYTSILVADKYYPAFLHLLYDGLTPEKAYAEVDNS